MRVRFLFAVAVVLLCTASPALAIHTSSGSAKRAVFVVKVKLHKKITYHKLRTWRLQDKTGVARTHADTIGWHYSNHLMSRIVRLWSARQVAARKAYAAHVERLNAAPSYSTGGDMGAWLCIHRYEGSWTDGGSPYYGGLQMDIAFQATYGPRVLGFKDSASMFAARGTADHWSPGEQIAVARAARDSGRGYYPWPNTARACGLI